MFRRILLVSLLLAGCAPNNAAPAASNGAPQPSVTPIAEASGSPAPTSPVASSGTQSSPSATPASPPSTAASSPPPTPGDTPAQASPTAPHSSAPVATPAPSAAVAITFGNGTYTVGKDIKPGTYRTRTPSKGCSWARLDGPESTDVAVSEVTDDVTIVTIGRTDVAFTTEDCGTWTSDLSRVTSSRTSFGPGTFIVGVDVAPGLYRNSSGTTCYWARLGDFSGNGVIASDQIAGRTAVTIDPKDKGFKSEGCGTWSKP